MNKKNSFSLTWMTIWLFLIILIVIYCYKICGEKFFYTLDDPYIHLRVAENILQGGYGINFGEYASPSSSIIYPFLLAVTEELFLDQMGPLVLNLASMGLAVWLAMRFLWEQAVGESGPRRAWFPHLLAPLVILACSGVALPLTGMEHSLHILAVIATLCGLTEVAEGRTIPRWLVPAIVAMPLIRFEGLVLAGSAIAALSLFGHRRSALAAAAAIAVSFLAFGILMHGMGLPLLPSSVLVKAGSGPTSILSLMGVFQNLDFSLSKNRWGILFALALCAILAKAHGTGKFGLDPQFRNNMLMAVIALTTAAHLAGGRFDAFDRYEVYVVVCLTIGFLTIFKNYLRRLTREFLPWARLGVLLAFAVIVLPYFKAALHSPRASRNIYEQQYQMHRFATFFFPRPVAINDLGLVSYHNRNFVLDLWGLGSDRVRRLRAADNFGAEKINDLTSLAKIDYAMVYKEWFPSLPQSWCLMATLVTERVSAAEGKVNFYATNSAVIREMDKALDLFEPTLPHRDQLERYSCGDEDQVNPQRLRRD